MDSSSNLVVFVELLCRLITTWLQRPILCPSPWKGKLITWSAMPQLCHAY